MEIIESAKLELKEDAIPVAKIKKDFFSRYQFQGDLIVKQFLGNNSSLIKLFQSESADFKVILIGKEHQVAIVPKIESSEEG